MLINMVYRADGNKGAADGGKIRAACKASCDRIEYSAAGISATLYGLDKVGQAFFKKCPPDCIVEVIGGCAEYYQAEVKSSHGGARPGAGRPPAKIARKSVRFSLTDDEKALVKQYIETLRR